MISVFSKVAMEVCEVTAVVLTRVKMGMLESINQSCVLISLV